MKFEKHKGIHMELLFHTIDVQFMKKILFCNFVHALIEYIHGGLI